MHDNNNYLKVYLDTISYNSSSKKIQSKVTKKSLSKNLLLENKRKLVKRRLILEEGKETVQCSFDVVVNYYNQHGTDGIPDQDLWSMPDFIFNGKDNYSSKEVTDNSNISNQLVTQIKNNIASKGVTQELEKRNKKNQQSQDKKEYKWCTIYFVEMGQIQDGKKGAPLYYLIDHSSKSRIFQIIPKQQNFLEEAHSNLRKYESKEDSNFKYLAATGSVGISILKAGWGIISAIGGAVADVWKDMTKGTPLENLFKSSSKDQKNSKKQKKKNYNQQVRPIIASLLKYVKQKGQGYKSLSNEDKAKLNFITGITPDKPVDGLFNYKKMLDEGQDINKDQYLILNNFRQKLAASLAIDKCDKMSPEEIQAQVGKTKGTDKDIVEATKLDPNFKKRCHTLGFRDKKSMGGFAAFFMNLLNKLMSLLGGDTTKKEVSGDKIKELCPYITSQVNKSIQPGKYPVYFGADLHKVTDSEMKIKFEAYCKK